MRYIYNDKVKGILTLIQNQMIFGKNFFENGSDKLYYTIAWNRGPAQKVKVDGVDYPFPFNAILPLMLNQTFHFDSPETITAWQFNREFYCILDNEAEVGCIGFLFYGPQTVLLLDTDDEFSKMLGNLLEVFIDEFQSCDDIQGQMLRMLLVRLIIKTTRLARQQLVRYKETGEQHFQLIRQFHLLVELNYRKEHMVQYYASQLNKSPKTLSNIFKICHSKCPSIIIQERITDQARRMLIYTNKSAKEISAELGFEEPGHFSRFFKLQTSVSPSEFRKLKYNSGIFGKP